MAQKPVERVIDFFVVLRGVVATELGEGIGGEGDLLAVLRVLLYEFVAEEVVEEGAFASTEKIEKKELKGRKGKEQVPVPEHDDDVAANRGLHERGSTRVDLEGLTNEGRLLQEIERSYSR